MLITKNTSIEELIDEVPEAIGYMMNRGIRCLRCGEPTWGTIETAAAEKGFTPEDIITIVAELNELKKR